MNKDKNYSDGDKVITSLLQRIKEEVARGTEYDDAVIIPCYRENTVWGYRRKDANIFAPLSLLYVLSSYQDVLPIGFYSDLKEGIKDVLPQFQNMHGGITYNFWKTQPSQHFPSGYLLHRFRHFKLPDDIDDTALAFDAIDSSLTDVKQLRLKIATHSKPFVKGEPYAYNTWFGDKMPYENDVCALSNLLSLFCKKGLPRDDRDIASENFLASVIAHGGYLENPFFYARHYGSSILIAYHLTRFVVQTSDSKWDRVKTILQKQVFNLFEKAQKEMDKVLMSSCLYKLGVSHTYTFNLSHASEHPFYPFIGAPLAPYNNWVSGFLASSRWAIIYWECEALKWTYCLENHVLSKAAS